MQSSRLDGKRLSEGTYNDVLVFVTLYVFIIVAGTVALSADPSNGSTVTVVSDAGEYTVTRGLATNLSAVVSSLSTVGTGLEAVGPYASSPATAASQR